ncbi:hypothetical protein [Sinorhizobium arboris]|uniref:hypothetical protein n=1 Tax=Sinorhizobium arboris TaxID=76745 RepID=UPI001F36F699|nr:hypothetical protein [Sinorhizobium arboris]
MAKHRSHSVEFKRQVAQEFLGGETHCLAKRHDVLPNLIRIWRFRSTSKALLTTMRRPPTSSRSTTRIAALEQ